MQPNIAFFHLLNRKSIVDSIHDTILHCAGLAQCYYSGSLEKKQPVAKEMKSSA